MEITKDEFQQWKESPVTKEVYRVINERIEDAKDILSSVGGEDQLNDRLLVGMIRAFREVQEVSFDD